MLLASPAGAVDPPSSGNAACDAARDRLVAAMRASPAQFTGEVDDALADAMDACAGLALTQGNGGALGHYKVKKALPCYGSVTGSGPMIVTIVVPFVAPVSYADVAAISYSSSSAQEEFKARDGTQTGFDVVKTSSGASGTMYIAGLPFAADDAATDGSCGGGVTPCHVVGFAGGFAGVYVGMSAEMNVCVSG